MVGWFTKQHPDSFLPHKVAGATLLGLPSPALPMVKELDSDRRLKEGRRIEFDAGCVDGNTNFALSMPNAFSVRGEASLGGGYCALNPFLARLLP
uniref:Uncharacterized protein n=1 Tax=Candidatus Kentrum sp. TC TaxID=2126339 RepID=A0A450Z9R0_9GAMM|nr:MAG: hypothetical protein BECKTC1821E_GA0114239_103912 [Candidatus Kentron sp. TC]VFK50544.1 MAG: hypothetical protein BECKTC1821D_GA0114238_11081 [Candidatus Kentron sp. TC]